MRPIRPPDAAPPPVSPPLSLPDSVVVDDPFRERAYRVVFTAAGVYNLAFGAWAGLFPGAFFRVFQLDPPRYPSLWACLGMVVGVYGLLYLQAARRLETAWPIIAVGLLGKVLGPAGLLWMAASGGDLPPRMLSLLVFNDLSWWLPFGLFLLEGTRIGERVRAAAPYLCAAVHVAALLMMALVLRGGTEAQASVAARAAYVVAHPLGWALGWTVWMTAAQTVAGFYAWWAARLPSRRVAAAVLVATAVGLACDLLGESLYAAWLPWLAPDVAAGVPGAAGRFAALQRAGTVLTGVAANGLYTLAGLALTLATPSRGRPLRLDRGRGAHGLRGGRQRGRDGGVLRGPLPRARRPLRAGRPAARVRRIGVRTIGGMGIGG
jgi:hypothetical protein